MAYTTLAALQPWVWPTPRPLWSFSYMVHVTQNPWASADPPVNVISAAHHPLRYTPLVATQPSASTDRIAPLTPLVFSLRPMWSQLLSSVQLMADPPIHVTTSRHPSAYTSLSCSAASGFNRPLGPMGPRCLWALDLCDPSYIAGFSLDQTSGVCDSRFSSAFGPYRPSSTEAFGFGRLHGPCDTHCYSAWRIGP